MQNKNHLPQRTSLFGHSILDQTCKCYRHYIRQLPFCHNLRTPPKIYHIVTPVSATVMRQPFRHYHECGLSILKIKCENKFSIHYIYWFILCGNLTLTVWRPRWIYNILSIWTNINIQYGPIHISCLYIIQFLIIRCTSVEKV